MPAAVVIGTMTVETDGPPGTTATGSANVMFEGRAACTIGHAITPHIRYGSKRPHGRVIASGSPNVIVNGKAAAFTGCAASCGDILGPGCTTVRVGP